MVEAIEGRTLMSAGALDATFATKGVLPSTVLAVDAQGRYLVPGTNTGKGYSDATLTRLKSDGSVDTTFGTNGTVTLGGGQFPTASQVFVEPSGKILVNYGSIGGYRQGGTLTQLTASGQIDTTFGTNGTASSGDFVVLGTDGKITSVDSSSQVVERLTAAGQVDTTFGTDGQVSLSAILPPVNNYSRLDDSDALGLALDAAGRPVVEANTFPAGTNDGEGEQLAVIRLTTAGKVDTTIGTDGVAYGPVFAVLVENQPSPVVAPNGTIYAGTTASDDYGATDTPELFALTASGKTVSGGALPTRAGGGSLDALTVDASSRPIVAVVDTATDSTGSYVSPLERLNPIAAGGGTPTLDSTFAASGAIDLPVEGGDQNLFLDAAGRILVTGYDVAGKTPATVRVQTAGPSSVTPAVASGPVIGSAGSYKNQGNTIAKAFDGNLSTFYDAAQPSGEWAGQDLRSAQSLVQIRFAPRAGYAARMVGGQFQVSSTADFSSDVHTVYTVTTAPASGTLTTVAVGDVGAYRYARYIGPAGGECDVAEVQFLVAGATERVGTVIGTAGSYQNGGNTIANAFDGDTSTYVDAPAGSNGAFVGEDLGTATAVTQVRFAPRAGYEKRMAGGVIQASNTADFSTGVVTAYTIKSAPAAGTLTTVSLSNVGAYRYWRYVGPAGSGDNIAELEFDA